MTPNKIATLTFNLDDPYATESFQNAIKADEMAMKIDEFHNEVTRPFIKYENLPGWDKPITDEQREILEHFVDNCLNYMYDREK